MTTHTDDSQQVDLVIGGMTCSSCAARIQKRLNKLDGVDAAGNYATEQARGTAPAGVAASTLIAEVEKAGYTAKIPAPIHGHDDEGAHGESHGDDHTAHVEGLRSKLFITLALTLPVVAMAMIPALQFDSWQWLSLALAAPVVIWG